MTLSMILVLFLFTCIHSIVITDSGTINGTSSFLQQSYSIPSGYGIFNMQFLVSTQSFSNVLALVSFSPITLNLTLQQLSYLIATNNSLLIYMDVISVIGGNTQIVNLYIPNSATSIYIGLFNFDLPQITTSKNYNLYLQFSNNLKICTNCPIGTNIVPNGNPLTCQCSPCPENALGTACQYSLNSIQGSNRFNVYNTPNKYFYVASTGSDIELIVQEISTTNSVRMYVQYWYPSGLMAGKLNSYFNSFSQPMQMILNGNTTKVTIPGSSLNVLITFRNTASTMATIVLTIPVQEQTSSSLIIVLAVVFSVIGVAVVIVVLCRIRRCLITRHSTVNNASQAVMADSNSLTDDQINKYFPQIVASLLLTTQINPSYSDSNLNANQSSAHRCQAFDVVLQCSICFDEVKTTDLIRITYCKHIFHGKCLLQWFHKNQNCPNCRQSCDFENTKRMRNQLGRKAKANSSNLVKAIMGENYLSQLKNKSSNKPPQIDNQLHKLEESKELEHHREREQERQEEATQNQISVNGA